MLLPLWILLLVCRPLIGQRLTPCDDDGYTEVEENSDLTLTCSGYTGGDIWRYTAPSSASTSTIAICSNTACTVPGSSRFSLVFNNASSSTLTGTLTSRAAAGGTYACGTARCRVAVIVAAVVEPGSLVVQKGSDAWSLSANNTITSVYSSRQEYNCVWFLDSQMLSPINQTSPSLTPLPSVSSDTSDRAGFCAASWPMPLNPGCYSYDVMVSPGNTMQSAGNITIARPDPPSLGGNCPTDFVPEFSPVTCSCVITNAGSPPADVTWSGMTSQTLTLNNVSRGDDNQRYTCILKWSSENLNATFDLRVAYGPYPGKTSISSNDVTGDIFDTDGSRNLTVSCDYPPADVSPGLTYSWDQPEACRGQVSRTCQFVPQLGNNVALICNVTNEKNQRRSAGVVKVIPLNYPPPLSPVITGYTTGDVLYANDSLTLTCDVTGGDPDVINVTLKCDNHPLSVTAGNRGSLTVTSLGADDHMTSCVCSSAWKVTSLYTKTSDVTLTVHSPPSPPSITSNDSTQFPYMEGDTPTLTCSSVSQGVPPATFLWSGLTEQDTVVTSPGNSQVQMGRQTRDDSRRDVTCNAINDFTQHRGDVTPGNFTISVYYADLPTTSDSQDSMGPLEASLLAIGVIFVVVVSVVAVVVIRKRGQAPHVCMSKPSARDQSNHRQPDETPPSAGTNQSEFRLQSLTPPSVAANQSARYPEFPTTKNVYYNDVSDGDMYMNTSASPFGLYNPPEPGTDAAFPADDLPEGDLRVTSQERFVDDTYSHLTAEDDPSAGVYTSLKPDPPIYTNIYASSPAGKRGVHMNDISPSVGKRGIYMNDISSSAGERGIYMNV